MTNPLLAAAPPTTVALAPGHPRPVWQTPDGPAGQRAALLWAEAVGSRPFVPNVVVTAVGAVPGDPLATPADDQRAELDQLGDEPGTLVLAEAHDQRLSTAIIGGREILQVTRWYRDPDSGERCAQAVASADLADLATDADLAVELQLLLDAVVVHATPPAPTPASESTPEEGAS